MQPFVQIECERMRGLDSGEAWSQLRRENSQGAERAVDVKPKLLVATQIGEGGEVVGSAGVDRPRGADDAEWLQAADAVLLDAPAQGVNVHAKLAVDAHPAQGRAAKPEQLEGFRQARMAFGRNIADQARAADALPANIGDGGSSRGCEAEEV